MNVTFPRMGAKGGKRCGAPARRGKVAERGFSLVEILIVVAIVGILTSVALPNMLHARKRAEMVGLLCIGALFQQRRDNFCVASIRCSYKGGRTVVGLHIDRRVLYQQRFDDFAMTLQ